jgi:hypothetical protein
VELDPRLLAGNVPQGPGPGPSLADAILAVLGQRTPQLSNSAPGALFENPIRLPELVVNARAQGMHAAPDAAAQVRVQPTMHGMPILPAMQAQPRDEPPNLQRAFARRGVLPQMEAPDRERAERIYEAIVPASYNSQELIIVRDSNGREVPRHESRAYRIGRALAGLENTPRIRVRHEREDAWRLYLGLPQKGNTFAVSPYRPQISREPGAIYLSIPNFLRNYQNNQGLSPTEAVRDMVTIASTGVPYADWGPGQDKDTHNGVMGNYKLSLGQDERGSYVSYYDKWDLDPTGYRNSPLADRTIDRLGRPFEIYGRIYYNPQTFEPINPAPRRVRR